VSLPDALAALAAGARGTQVTHQVHGSPRQLPPQASLAVYRTAQEALANARKHAPGAPVTMTLSFDPHQTVLDVRGIVRHAVVGKLAVSPPYIVMK
jgi:signal transduction histidine kinase